MKGIKYILPVVGIFLVFYIASVLMSAVKANGVISQLNEQYNEDFTLVYSKIGNVFFDDDYLLAVKSNENEILYEFDYSEEEIKGNYEEERLNGLFNIFLEKEIDAKFHAFTSLENASLDGDDIRNVKFEQATINIVSEKDVSNEVAGWFNQFGQFDKIEIRYFIGASTALDKFEQELLPIKQRSNITDEIFEQYDLKQKGD